MGIRDSLMRCPSYLTVRLLVRQVAREHGRALHRLSFTGKLHRLRARDGREQERLMAQLLIWIADDLVPDRPNRFEPRRVKRRAKPHDRV